MFITSILFWFIYIRELYPNLSYCLFSFIFSLYSKQVLVLDDWKYSNRESSFKLVIGSHHLVSELQKSKLGTFFFLKFPEKKLKKICDKKNEKEETVFDSQRKSGNPPSEILSVSYFRAHFSSFYEI